MIVSKFIELTISEIRAGIDEFNDSECLSKAHMPTEIEFDIWVMKNDKGEQELVEINDSVESGEKQNL